MGERGHLKTRWAVRYLPGMTMDHNDQDLKERQQKDRREEIALLEAKLQRMFEIGKTRRLTAQELEEMASWVRQKQIISQTQVFD